MDRFLQFALAAFLITLSACSTSENFVVLNRSLSPISVLYQWKGCSDGESTTGSDRMWPAKLSIREFEQGDREWRVLTDEQFNSDGCIFSVDVKPNEALRIERTFNYGGSSKDTRHLHFGIHDITITGRNGSIHLVGSQAQNGFQENKSGDFVINYE